MGIIEDIGRAQAKAREEAQGKVSPVEKMALIASGIDPETGYPSATGKIHNDIHTILESVQEG